MSLFLSSQLWKHEIRTVKNLKVSKVKKVKDHIPGTFLLYYPLSAHLPSVIITISQGKIGLLLKHMMLGNKSCVLCLNA